MQQHFVVYFKNKPFVFSNFLDASLQRLSNEAGVIMINQPDEKALRLCIRDINDTETEAIVILTRDVEHYWQKFLSHFEWIEAAGGLVVNNQNQVLFMKRRGYWDLPKGKLDPGETLAECAVREVQEETGLQQLELVKFLLDTFHVYPENGKSVLKKTSWFLMKAEGDQALIPQLTEDITELEFVDLQLVSQKLAQSFPSVSRVVQYYTNPNALQVLI